MATCPNCFQEIDSLDSQDVYNSDFHLDEQGQPVYQGRDEPSLRQYFCPNCRETLAMNEAKAIAVLKDTTALACSHCDQRSTVQEKRKATGIISKSASLG